MEVYTGEKNHKIQSPEDRDSLIYQQGFKSGTEHTRPSPETLTKIAQMSEDITNLKLGVQDVSKDVKYLVKTLEEHVKEEGEYRENQEAFHKDILDKKAGKWVENVIIWLGIALGTIGIGLSTWFVKTVFNKIF